MDKFWLAGLAFSIVIGGLVTALFLYSLRGALALGSKPKPKGKRVPPWVTGTVERLSFTILVALDVSGAGPAMMGWLAIKLAINWQRKDIESTQDVRAFSVSALLAGLVSMTFAFMGGQICSQQLWYDFVRQIFS